MIKEIFVHCSATPPDWMAEASPRAQFDEIDRWHKARGWRGFGYNEMIARDGQRFQGRPIGATTAAAKGHNTNAIHICLIGGKGSNATDFFSDHFTHEQELALIDRLRELKQSYPDAKIRGHNEVAAKACPGFTVKDWWLDVQAGAGREDKATASAFAAFITLLKGIFHA